MCPACHNLIKKEIKEEASLFDKYIKEALDVIESGTTFKADPSLIKEIARKYRNEAFHGSFLKI